MECNSRLRAHVDRFAGQAEGFEAKWHGPVDDIVNELWRKIEEMHIANKIRGICDECDEKESSFQTTS
jgi:hypothetical protein